MKPIRQTSFLSRCGTAVALAIATLLCAGAVHAQVPLLLNYQGRVVVGTTNFNGTGQFKFALVNTNGTTTFWSNDGTSTAGSQPTGTVSLAVTNGLYSVLLGDTTLANMTATIPGNLFNNLDVRLRVWFNDGTNGSQLLSPDQRIGSAGYAGVAGTVPDGAITTAKIGVGAVQSNNIATGAVAATQLANGAVNVTKIDTTQVQARVSGIAPPGSFITGINANGTVTTAPDNTGGSSVWSLNGTNAYYNGGNVGLGTTDPTSKLDLRGNLTIEAGASPILYAGTGSTELNRYLQLINSFNSPSASGLKAGGLLVADSFGYANPGKNDLIVKGSVGIGTTSPASKLTVATPTTSFGLEHMDIQLGTRVATRVDGFGAQFGTITDSHLSLRTNDKNRMIIYHTGHVEFFAPDAPDIPPKPGLTVITDAGELGFAHLGGAVQLNTLVPSSGILAGCLGTTTNHPLLFFTNHNNITTPSFSRMMLLDTAGRVGIGRASGANKLEVEGNASKTTAGDWLTHSDARIKTDVRTVSGALDKLAHVRLVQFRYTDDYRAAHSGIADRDYLNVIAQEFQQVFPESVQRSGDRLPDGQEILQVDTHPLTIYSAAAIQELNTKLEDQRAENATLQTESSALKKRVTELEVRLTKLEQFLPPTPPASKETAATHLKTP